MARIENLQILFYKQVQAWHTHLDCKLLYMPTLPHMQVICDKMVKLLEDCERQFVSKMPSLLPGGSSLAPLKEISGRHLHHMKRGVSELEVGMSEGSRQGKGKH